MPEENEVFEEEFEELEQEAAEVEEEEREFTDEELDLVADTAIDALKEILEYFDITTAEINEYEGDEGEIILDIVGGDELAILIGRRGRTLDALQLIVSTISFRKLGFRYPVTIDVESYKHRQRQKIESMAASAASRAYRQDREVKLRPMNPWHCATTSVLRPSLKVSIPTAALSSVPCKHHNRCGRGVLNRASNVLS